MTYSSDDDRLLCATVSLGRRNLGICGTNPAVGALVVQNCNGKHTVIGRGWTSRHGSPHAEENALSAGGAEFQGSTLYTSLEPCTVRSRGGPSCCRLILKAGVSRIVVATEDSNPLIHGHGLEFLSRSGLEVVLAPRNSNASHKAREAHQGHETRHRTGRPLVTLKLACSRDGFIARAAGEPTPLSGVRSRRHCHAMRAHADAILIGSGTCRADNPRLDCRLPGMGEYSPVPVIVGSEIAQSEMSALLLRHGRIIHCLPGRSSQMKPHPSIETVVCEGLPEAPTHCPIECVLENLAARGFQHVFVEGGGRIARSFVDGNWVDRFVLYVSREIVLRSGVPLPHSLVSLESRYSTAGFTRCEYDSGSDRVIEFVRSSDRSERVPREDQ